MNVNWYLIVSALVPYKKVELAMETAEATGKRLVVIGGGPLYERFAAHRLPNVELLGHVSRARIIERLGRARSLILWGDTDRVLDPSGVAILQAALDHPVTVVMKRCGHAPMIERPQETAEHYLRFLQGV